MSGPFYGKYRGVVTDNVDPQTLGRVRARVDDVLGSDPSGWALPCAPYGGDGNGLLVVPPVGSGVWIEFEHGDPDHPIWSGCWWGSAAERPPESAPPSVQKVLLQTPAGHKILLDDTPASGGITIQTAEGAKIALTPNGIEIDNGTGGKISLATSSVSINDGALEVT